MITCGKHVITCEKHVKFMWFFCKGPITVLNYSLNISLVAHKNMRRNVFRLKQLFLKIGAQNKAALNFL